MARTPPPYIPFNIIAGTPVTHRWDDDDPYEVLPELDQNLQEEMLSVTDIAKAAFVIGCAEWVVYRFSKASIDRFPLDYIEASWARLIDPSLGKVWEPDDWDDWLGPIRGPIATTLLTITNVYASIEEGVGADTEAAFASSIARHVLPDTQQFLLWQEVAVARLQRAYAIDESDPTGPPVPREALDPSFELTTETALEALQAFKQSLDFPANDFLIEPEE
jgi:hypothetical protein